jgi:hypothetical protein
LNGTTTSLSPVVLRATPFQQLAHLGAALKVIQTAVRGYFARNRFRRLLKQVIARNAVDPEGKVSASAGSATKAARGGGGSGGGGSGGGGARARPRTNKGR